MAHSTAPINSEPKADASAGVTVLLLDTPENLGVDFLQSLQRQDLKLNFERVNDKEDLYAALRQGSWDLLLVCDQVNVPGQDETLAFLKQIDSETGYVLLSKAELSIDMLTRAYRKGIAAVVSAHNPEYSLQVFMREAERCRRNSQLVLLNREKSDLKRHCMQLMSGTQEALAYLEDGIHVFGNEAYLKLLGYEQMDDLLVVPFIDLVSTEMREKTKQRLLDYQHRARMQPDTKELEIPELFVTAVGAREGILQVAATFKPVVYEGQSCVQVVFKFRAGEETREESGAAEGLGYALFTTHVDSLVAQARSEGRALGQVLHIRGLGFEHYIPHKGFGSLNGKFKALASELKAALGKEDLLIRFTETSFLALHKSGGSNTQVQEAIGTLLGKFETALNREIGSAKTEKLISFTVDTMPVDAESPPAEQIVRKFLQTRQPPVRSEATAVEAAAKAAAPSKAAAPVKAEAPAKAEAPIKVEAAKAPEPPVLKSDAAKAPAPKSEVPKSPAPSEAPKAPVAKSPAPTPETAVDPQRLSSALSGNQLKLMYETVISVADIETEFHDVCVMLPAASGGGDYLSRAVLGGSDLAGKLDQWTLHNALAVIADLYNRGQEYPVLISLSGRSLGNKRLAETVRSELQNYGLPPEMLILDFSVQDIAADRATALPQLEKLKGEGVSLCLSEVRVPAEVQDILKQVRIERVRLQRAFVEEAAHGDKAFTLLKQGVEQLHALKAKVFAGDVSGSNELSLCCKAGIDLVKGKCIQKSPQELDADSMAEALMT